MIRPGKTARVAAVLLAAMVAGRTALSQQTSPRDAAKAEA